MVKINFQIDDIVIVIDDELKTSSELIKIAFDYALAAFDKSLELQSKWNIEPGDCDTGDKPKDTIKPIIPDINFKDNMFV